VALPGSQGWALDIHSAHKSSIGEKVGLSRIKGAVIRLRCVWSGESSSGADEEIFASSRLGPTRNLARPASTVTGLTEEFPATPIHASSLHFASLPLLTQHLSHFHTLSLSHPSFAAAVRLLQSWATHRSFGSSIGPSSEFWAWCVARTLDWGASSTSNSSGGGGEVWAGWRKTVEWLAGVDWVEGIFFRVDGNDGVRLCLFHNTSGPY
jgi:U3 small nucleolar RNA-associated protein 22